LATFTQPARDALRLARDGAQRWNHTSLGIEHLLLGLLLEGEGVVARSWPA
jgi:Clp amino terminal domain, pathogenicity island component